MKKVYFYFKFYNMKRLYKHLALLFLMSFTLSSMTCETNDDRLRGSAYKATYMKRSDFENSIKITGPNVVKKAGKIYLKDQYMFIGDTNRGFHIYDNTNNDNPILIAFLEMPGVTDIAIRGDVFYANQAVDLIAFKINYDSKQIEILKRIPNTFPEIVSPDGYIQNVGLDNVVVDWN